MTDFDDSEVGLDAKVRALNSPTLYPEPTRRVESIETHFSWIFLTDRFAYKLKKPITADRLSHSTLESRRLACESEVRLNLRLAPEVYLSVVPIAVGDDGAITMGPGRVVDWLVKMRRLSAESMLDRVIADNRVDFGVLDVVGKRLATFYLHQPPASVSVTGYLNRIRGRIEENYRELSAPDLGQSEASMRELKDAQVHAYYAVAPQLGTRAMGRRIVEGHGDLRPEHIYLGQPPCVIDALEFSADLRLFDPAEELAYLAVECITLKRNDVATAIVRSYQEAARDFFSERLFHFYKSQRAATRAKVVAWHLRDPDFAVRQDWPPIVRGYLDDSLRYALCATTDVNA